MFDFIVAFIIGLIPLVLGIIKKKIKFGLIGFVTCIILWIVATPIFGLPVLVIFIWFIVKKPTENDEYIKFNYGNKFILMGIVIPVILIISGVAYNAIGGYASFYIFMGTPIILLIIGSYVFSNMNKDNDKHQIRSNSGIIIVSAMVSFMACSALVLVFIQIHLINTMDIIRFLIVATSSFIFSLLDILLMLFVTLGIKRFKR